MSAPRIVIVGGGTAGWMAACLMAKAWPAAPITVVESPDIGIVGVGEGSTPQLKAFFDTLGIAEAAWMPRCNATYKTGIGFHGWSERPGYTAYFHPFPTALDGFTAPQFYAAALARRRAANVDAHPDRFFLPADLARHAKAPLAADNFPFDISYGYHFDAHLIGTFLAEHATRQLGVRHLSRRVIRVEQGDDGAVTALLLDGDECLTGELFVDASGFRALLVDQALKVPFRSFADNLFNDSAVVMPTPADPVTTSSMTTATALGAGWAWRIPLTNRTGNGYVYSSRYLDGDAAETALRTHLGMLDSPVAARHLKMRVGRVETSWSSNVLAIGLAQGFLEPLEATALHLVQATVEGFIEAYAGDGFGAANRDAFNTRIAARYEGVRDYIVAHYKLNQRSDTDYWRDNAGHHRLSDSLKAILTCWYTGKELAAEIAAQDIARYYAPASWHCLLAGYGTFPPADRLRDEPTAAPPLARIDDFIARCGRNFPDHRTALATMSSGVTCAPSAPRLSRTAGRAARRRHP